MSPFLFLFFLVIGGTGIWVIAAPSFPKLSTAGGCLAVIALAAILWGMHPSVPGIVR